MVSAAENAAIFATQDNPGSEHEIRDQGEMVGSHSRRGAAIGLYRRQHTGRSDPDLIQRQKGTAAREGCRRGKSTENPLQSTPQASPPQPFIKVPH